VIHLNTARVGAALYYNGLRALGATSLRRLTKNAGLILCYHNVVWREADQIGDPELHIPAARFERQIRWLVDHYEVVSLNTFVDRLESGASLNETAVITFDDGYAGVFDYGVPVLEALDVPATVFVIADAPGRSMGFWWDCPEVVTSEDERRIRWLTELRGDQEAILSDVRVPTPLLPATLWPAEWSEIRRAARGPIDIGVHSATHRALTALRSEELKDEIATSRLMVRRATGITPKFFAYPYGLWNAQVRAAVRAAGYRASLALGHGLNEPTADRWTLGRLNVPGEVSDAAFEAWAAGFDAWRS
jgi:peptidoglycan/xylan/chitin deacetylase (PgdA/CDA1 family)